MKPFPVGKLPEGTLIADGHDAALIGWSYRLGHGVTLAIYDRELTVAGIQEANGWSREDAEEWMSFNVEGAWVGEGTPIFVVTQYDELEDE